MRNIAISRTPYRLSITGGTDLWPYVRRHGGAAFSAGLDKYATIVISRRSDDTVQIVHPGGHEHVEKIDDITHPIIREGLRRYNLSGLSILSHSDIPPGSGLGSSGAFTVGLLNALHWLQGEKRSTTELAEEAADIEINALKSPIGKHDQYIAALGGLQHLIFNRDGTVTAKKVALPKAAAEKLKHNLFLVFSGIRRDASGVLSQTMSDLSEEATFDLYTQFKEQGDAVRESLVAGRVEEFASNLNKLMAIKARTIPGSTNPQIASFIESGLKGGALGAKNSGAGAGGFVYFYVPEGRHQSFTEAVTTAGGTIYPYSFTDKGTEIVL